MDRLHRSSTPPTHCLKDAPVHPQQHRNRVHMPLACLQPRSPNHTTPHHKPQHATVETPSKQVALLRFARTPTSHQKGYSASS